MEIRASLPRWLAPLMSVILTGILVSKQKTSSGKESLIRATGVPVFTGDLGANHTLFDFSVHLGILPFKSVILVLCTGALSFGRATAGKGLPKRAPGGTSM